VSTTRTYHDTYEHHRFHVFIAGVRFELRKSGAVEPESPHPAALGAHCSAAHLQKENPDTAISGCGTSMHPFLTAPRLPRWLNMSWQRANFQLQFFNLAWPRNHFFSRPQIRNRSSEVGCWWSRKGVWEPPPRRTRTWFHLSRAVPGS